MSGRDHHRGLRSGLFHTLIGSLKRGGTSHPEPAPEPEDLGLKTLRQVYSRSSSISNPVDKERQIYKLLPLFCINCSKHQGNDLVRRFPEIYEFAEDVIRIFVNHIHQSAQVSNMASRAITIFKYFEPSEDPDICGAGFTILKVVKILASGPESLVDVVMNTGFCSVLIQCISLFLQLPPPVVSGSHSNHTSPRATPYGSYGSSPYGSYGSQRSTPPHGSHTMPRTTPTYGSLFSAMGQGQGSTTSSPSPTDFSPPSRAEQAESEMSERQSLESVITEVLNKTLRFSSAVKNVLKEGNLLLMFGAISSPCPQYNKMWRKCAAHSLLTICRYSLSGEVIKFIHSNGCIRFCVHNLTNTMEQSPLEVVEIIATVFCCLKDSSDFSQVLLDDFNTNKGYKFLYDYLLFLETSSDPDAAEALRNLVLLIQNLVMAGFHNLEPSITDGGPFQVSPFHVPTPLNQGSTVKNIPAVVVLKEAFLSSTTTHLGLSIINAFLYIFKSDPANYFIVAPHHTLSSFIERIPEKNEEVQADVFKLVDHVIVSQKYIPAAELTNIGLLLGSKEYPKTVALCLNFFLRLISYRADFRHVFRDAGILLMLINALKAYASDFQRDHEQTNGPTSTGLSSPSLPLENIQGDDEECMFLLMECLRATIEGVEMNGQVFRDNHGTECALGLVQYSKPRRMALKLLRQIILLEDGALEFSALLAHLNQTPQTSVNIKSEILQTFLGVFQLESSKKAVFREVNGFHYLISVLASLIGSLSPVRVELWTKVPRADILQLVQLVFTVMTSAMQDDPANKNFFEKDIRYDSFTAPLLLLGCFSKDVMSFKEAPPTSDPQNSPPLFQSSGSFSNFDAEFKTWKAPSENLDENSYIYCAAEIFRFLRDMALDIPASQSTSLLQPSSQVNETAMHKREKQFYGDPPVTSIKAKLKTCSQHLIHPGAVLCMIDLLPSVVVPREMMNLTCGGSGTTSASLKNTFLSIMPPHDGHGITPPHDITPHDGHDISPSCEGHGTLFEMERNSPSVCTPSSPSHESNDSFYDAVGETSNKLEAEGVELKQEEVWHGEKAVTSKQEVGSEEEAMKYKEEEKALEGKEVDFDELVEPAVVEVVEVDVNDDDREKMSPDEAKKWCVFLQERVVSEIYSLSFSERNQQALCQVGLPQRILVRCFGVLADELHPLHQALERTFEKLSYQALTPSDFRNFLRLGNPLCCLYNSVDVKHLEKLIESTESSNQNAPYGGSLSLARIQSLVTMTTPRDGFQPTIIGAPPFVEFDLSIDGFGCLFLPSVFPHSEPSTAQSAPITMVTSGVGEGGRIFPPSGGLSFTTWILISKYSKDESALLSLLSLSQTSSFSSSSMKVNHYPCLLISIKPADKTLVISTQLPRDSLLENAARNDSDFGTEKKSETIFNCKELLQAQSWNHVAVAMQKPGLRGKAKVTLFINGQPMATQKMSPIHILSPSSPQTTEATPILINAHIGTHVTQRHVSLLTYRLGPTFLFEEHLSSNVVGTMYKLGPSYFGSFQAPILQTSSLNSTHGSTLSALVAEERIVFGLIATHPLIRTVQELDRLYAQPDVMAVRRELSLSESDDITPVTLLHNTAVHLTGPSRTLGAIMCGYSGIRFFQPQPLRTLLSSVGGTKVVLGLVAMATTVDNLYASMKALVCIIGNNQVALKEMERTGGFKVLGMLLRSKCHLINSNILHLTYTLVGTVDSEQESACIPNYIAFQDLLADLAIWNKASEDIQRSLFSHFFDLLSHTGYKSTNAEHMLKMRMVSVLLFRLLDESLSVRTIKSICNVISTLLGIMPKSADIRRVGQLLATTLPSNQTVNENNIRLYENSNGPAHFDDSKTLQLPTEYEQKMYGRFHSDEGQRQRTIILRNILLDVLISLLTRDLKLNSQFARELYQSLGFDWLFLFMHATIHTETVVRAVRILVQLLCDSQLQQHFVNGDIFGGWVKGFDSISDEMTQMFRSLVYLNPFPTSPQTQQIPGPLILAHLLPNHSNLSQIYLLLSATMLGHPCTDIPFSAKFDMETLEEVFNIGDPGAMADRVSGDAACILLTIARALLHKDPSNRALQENAVNLIKFFERLYKTLPDFTRLASSSEFIEGLISTLFPPLTYQDPTPSVSDSEVGADAVKPESEGDDWIMIETEVLPGTGGKEESDAILNHQNNLAVCTILKLLRTIAIDGFSSANPMTKDTAANCPILERILSSTPPGISQKLLKQYQTSILQNMMDYIKAGSEDVMVMFKEGVLGVSVERSLCGLAVFCARLVDKVWHGYFLNPAHTVYTFLFWMVEQSRRTPKTMPLMDIQRSLNRLILFQVSRVPGSETEQKSFMDTLCMYSSQAHVIFDELNVDDQFLECLTFRLLRVALYEKFLPKNPLLLKMDSIENDIAIGVDHSSLQGKLPSGYVPGSLAMMKSGANRLWTKMLEYKKIELERLLEVELPSPGDSHMIGHVPPNMGAGGNRTFLRLQNCHLFLTDSLERTWKDFMSEEKSQQTSESSQKEGTTSTLKKGAGIVATMASKVRRKRGTTISKDNLVHEFVMVLSQLLILASQKFYELLLRKHQRNAEYRLRFASSEWNKIEYELTRERGLWGPDRSTVLDKWMVDTVEGPCRMRKRLQKNHKFYQRYPYQPQLAKVKTKHQKPTSSDSELQSMRERLFQRPTLLATPTHLTTDLRDNESVAKAPDFAVDSLEPLGTPSRLAASNSSKFDVFNHPDSDDPVAQTLYKMIEPDDKVNYKYQCARLTGLDSQDGVLLLGSTHFYMIEGITITTTDDIIDIESAPEGSYEPVVPGNIHTHTNDRGKSQIPIQCIKLSYDTIREVHKRRYLLRHCAVEVFASDGRSHFLIFHPKYRDKIYQKLLSLAKSSLTQGDSQYIAGIHPETDPEHSQGLFSVLTGEKSLVEKWVNGEMSNFQYLMHLNTLAGRSYNDLMQYPIFPWILADYTSENLDLSDPKTFRDLSKPMGAQSEARLKRFIERYKYFEDPTGENTPPYYYGTHYSSAMIVASYLIRMEPFAMHFLKLQGGHFDLPDRLFHSIPDAWRSASETNMADIKELIPEFFYLPEFLVNSNNFELGTKQSGEVLGNIILPPWSKGDSHEFIRVHRQALECDYVSANLHKWIDLIFGYKQGGDEALVNHNVFHHLFYEGAVDIDKIEDPMKRNAAISFIHNFGQMPKQIFKKPHRQRKVASLAVSQDVSAPAPSNLLDSNKVFYKNLVQLMPSKEPIRIIAGEVTQMVCPSDNKIPMAVDKNKIFLPWSNYRNYFVWGFPDHSARIASVETDRVIAVFEGLHQGRILCASVPDDNTLLTSGESTVVCVWEIRHGGSKERAPTQLHLRHTLHGHTGPVCCLATSSSYNLIVSGSRDKTCILWDMTTFSFVRQLCDHSGAVIAVTINQLSGNIVSCTKNQIRLWTVNGTLLAETPIIIASNVKILCCAVSEMFDWDKDNVIITGSSDGIVRMWTLEYVSDEELKDNKLKKGTAADSIFIGGETSLDFFSPRERQASMVVDRLKKVTISSRTRAKTSPNVDISDQLLASENQEEQFRPTGQPHLSQSSLGRHPPPDLQKESPSHTPHSDNTQTIPKVDGFPSNPQISRTFSEDTEEERTAGSGTDLMACDDVGNHDLSGDMSHDDEHMSCNQVGVLAESEEGDFSGGEEQEGEVAGQKNGSKVDEVTEYAKYISEKKRESDLLKMKTGNWSRRLKLVHTLTMHTSIHRRDNDKPSPVTCICISKDHRRMYVGDSLGRIFSWTVSDNLGGVMQHWVLDSAVNNCQNCGVEFTFTERKHHCRDCGKIFCAKCSSYECEVERLRIHKKVRVCCTCYSMAQEQKTN